MSALYTANLVGFGPSQFDSLAKTVPASVYTLVALLQLGGSRQTASFDLLVATAALTGLQFSRTSIVGGTHTPTATDASCNTTSNDVLSANPTNLYQLAAGAVGHVRLGGLQGVQELGIWAKSGSGTATLRVVGGVA